MTNVQEDSGVVEKYNLVRLVFASRGGLAKFDRRGGAKPLCSNGTTLFFLCLTIIPLSALLYFEGLIVFFRWLR